MGISAMIKRQISISNLVFPRAMMPSKLDQASLYLDASIQREGHAEVPFPSALRVVSCEVEAGTSPASSIGHGLDHDALMVSEHSNDELQEPVGANVLSLILTILASLSRSEASPVES